ncbi:MAG: hypothetical protein AB7S80_11685 [Rhizobiaceae bacterium]
MPFIAQKIAAGDQSSRIGWYVAGQCQPGNIDYYDRTLAAGSDDPADAHLTRRNSVDQAVRPRKFGDELVSRRF